VIHHGGAGTAGAAFSSGVPSMAVPVYADQPLWGERIRALGDRIRDLRAGGGYRAAATDLAERIRTEDGAARVIAALEDL
jgi:hypothetical protein